MNKEEFINKLLDDIHNINPELSQKRQDEFNKLLQSNPPSVSDESKPTVTEDYVIMWQHEKTGRTGFIDKYQAQNGFFDINPRLKEVGKYLPENSKLQQPTQPQADNPKKCKMTTERIKDIQFKTAYPDSKSVYQALLQVWNECQQQAEDRDKELIELIVGLYSYGHNSEKGKYFRKKAKELLTQFRNQQQNSK